MFIRLIQIRQFLAAVRFFSSTSQLFSKVISLVLMIALLSNTTFAIVPGQVLLVTTTELGQDVRYAFLTNPTLQTIAETLFDNPVLAFVTGKGRKKQQSIAGIEVSPKQVTIREGEQLALTAIALDGQNNPVQGVGFKWTAARAINPNQPNQMNRPASVQVINGIFKPQHPGLFEVTAEAAGVKGVMRVNVVKDAYYLALKEADKQLQAQGKEALGNKAEPQRKLRPDVQKVLAESKTWVFNNSTRMNEAQVRELNQAEAGFRKANPNKPLVDQSKPRPEIRKAPPMTKGQGGQVNQESEDDVDSVVKRGGPNAEVNKITQTEENSLNNKTVRLVSGQLDPIMGTTVTGCAYDPNNGYLPIDLYLDGDNYTGSYLTTVYPGSYNLGCYPSYSGFEFNIPNTYWDGQLHTISAYTWDYDYYQYVQLSSSPQYFQINGGGGGTNSNWGNNNFNTADEPGQQPGSPANDGTDGAGSSNFSFAAPVLSLGGRGMNVNLSLSYNSLLWHQAGGEISYDIDKGFPGPGWNIGFGKMMDMGTTGGAMIEDLDGTRHAYEGTTETWGSYSTYHGRTVDGSFIDYKASRGPGGLTAGVAYLANGTIITYGAAANGVLYPTHIKDRHGNYLNIAYQSNQGPHISTITDNLGRAVTFNYDGSNRLVSISGPAQNNTTRVYVRLHYAQKTVTPSFSGLTPQVRDANPYQLDAIYYPDLNTGYWFGDNDSYSSYGMIAKVSERRGMSWSGANNNDQGTITQGTMSREMVYNYPLTGASLTTAPQYTSMTESWANMDTSPAVTTYSINNSASPRTTTITLPNGNKIKQSSYNNPNQWNDGLLYQVETLSPSNAVLAKAVTTWALGDYNSARVTQLESTDEKNQTTKQTFTYDTYYNQVATISEYGYSNNLLRTKVNTYENSGNYRGSYTTINSQPVWSAGRHIFSLLKSEEILDASSVRLSRNEYNYDQATLMDTPSVVMYDQTYNPHTTETYSGCHSWNYNYEGCTYDWEWIYDYNYQMWVMCEQTTCADPYSYSIFEPSTAYRGNLTETITYSSAANLQGAIAYQYTYDITGNTRTATTDCCQQIAFTYSTNTQYSQPDSQYKGSATDANLRNTVSAVYDYNTGLTKSVTNANGRVTHYYYDAANRPTITLLPTGAELATYYHNGNDNLIEQRTYAAGTIGQSHSVIYFNGRGQVRVVDTYAKLNAGDYWNPSNWTRQHIQYDQMGRKVWVNVPHLNSTGSAGATTYQYDLLSRVTQVTAPDGSTSKTFYNEGTKPSAAVSNVGNTVRSQDAWGRERWARTDDFGRLVEVVEPDPNGNGSVFDAGNVQTQYTYTPLDQLQQVNQGSQVRMFWYDSLGRLVRQKLAEQNGSLTYNGQFVGGDAGGWSDVFVYDNRSNLIQRTDARGVKTNFVYNNDPLNRLQQINYDKTGADTTYTIHDASPANLSYMTTGDKTRVSSVGTWYVFEENSYDVEGRVAEYQVEYAQQSGQKFVTSYLYDSLSRLTEVRYPAQYGMSGNPRKIVTPEYDETSRLKELKVDNQIQMSEIVYNPLSQVTQLKTGAATGNADIEQYSYDGQTGLLTNQKVIKQNTSTTLLDLSYNYNRGSSNGSINGKTGQLTNIVDNLNRNRDRVYEFDSLGRLRTAKGGTAAGGSGTANWIQQYSHDRYGNRTNVTASGITQDSQAVPLDGNGVLSYDNTSNRINTANYIYDLAGNLVKGQAPDGVWQIMEYDSAGRLVTVKKEADGWIQQNNGYGASRQRVVSWSYADTVLTWYVWGGRSVLAEYTAPNWQGAYSWVKSYIYAGSRLLSTFTKNGSSETLEFHHPDRLGTKLVTNNTANTSYQQSTLPFGTALNAESTGYSSQVFTSYDRSNVASLDYAVNRSYSSGQGRFTTVDPIGMASASILNPQSNNLYAYVENNPIDFTDPLGLFSEPKEEPIIIHTEAPHWDSGWIRFLLESYARMFTYPIQTQDVGGPGKPPKQDEGCTFNINITYPKEWTEIEGKEYEETDIETGETKKLIHNNIRNIEAEITRLINIAGHKVVFNSPKKADAGSYNLEFVPEFYGKFKSVQKDVAALGATIGFNILGWQSIRNQGQVNYNRVSGVKALANVGVHESFHYFLRKWLAKHGVNNHDAGIMAETGTDGEFTDEQKAAMAELCKKK